MRAGGLGKNFDMLLRRGCVSLPAMKIPELRKAIDQLDARIVQLLNERTRHVLEIGAIKLKAGETIYVPHRERMVLQRIAKLNHGPMTEESLRAIYREIMSSALSLQKTMTIAYLGPEATFTHQAAIQKFGASLRYTAQRTIADVFGEVSKNRADYGVAPVENSTEGVVEETLDMFVESELKIVAQVILPIRYCLAGRSETGEVQRLYVHPQALAQCRLWVRRHLPRAEILETSSNARSAELAAQPPGAGKSAGRSLKTAAITGVLAAEKYGLKIIEHNLQDLIGNATRFFVLGRQCSPPSGRDRTSLMLSIADQVGALYNALGPFRRFRLNMTKIESRPSKRKAWEYFFFVDCDGHFEDRKVARAIAGLESVCNFAKVLGSYPNSE
jgi:chorismate mutase/prephenate dehydratase